LKRRGAIALPALLALGACSDAVLVAVPPVQPVRDDRLSVSGTFCTDPPQPAEFPVRVLFIVDTSQSTNVTDPAPIPADELQRTNDWLKSWGMMEKTEDVTTLVNMLVQERAHIAAE
jgi:hypothetical protein